VEDVLNHYSAPVPEGLEDVLAADVRARELAGQVMERLIA